MHLEDILSVSTGRGIGAWNRLWLHCWKMPVHQNMCRSVMLVLYEFKRQGCGCGSYWLRSCL